MMVMKQNREEEEEEKNETKQAEDRTFSTRQ